MSDELPEFVRLRGGGFAWRERELPQFERFRKELLELDEPRVLGGRLAKLDRLIALTVTLDLTESERDVARDAAGREFTDDERDRWNTLNERLDAFEVRGHRIAELAGNPRAREDGAHFLVRGVPRATSALRTTSGKLTTTASAPSSGTRPC
jgi:hypothetical protein